MSHLTCVVASILLTGAAFADTLTISSTDGSADFDDIQAAVNAALPGDVLVIGPGLYRGFELDKSLRLRGVGEVSSSGPTLAHDVQIVGPSRITGGSSSDVVRMENFELSDLRLEGGEMEVQLSHLLCATLQVDGWRASVLAEGLRVGLTAPDVSVTDAALVVESTLDLRVVRSTIAGWFRAVDAVHVSLARAEFVECVIAGAEFYDGRGVVAGAGSDVTLALCEVRGGAGSPDYFGSFGCGSPGDGGSGVEVQDGGAVRIQGRDLPADPLYFVRGGFEGNGGDCGCDGDAGSGLVVQSGGVARSSGIEIFAGGVFCADGSESLAIELESGASFEDAAQLEPLVRRVDEATPAAPGDELRLEVFAAADSLVLIAYGLDAVLLPLGPIPAQLLVAPVLILPLGTAAQSPINSPNTWLISGAVVKSPCWPMPLRVA